MVKVAVDDFNDPNVGLVFPDAFLCAIDWAIAHDWDLANASLTIDPFTAPIDGSAARVRSTASGSFGRTTTVVDATSGGMPGTGVP